MHDLHLVLKFRLAGDNQFQTRGASRIKVDGRGGLMFYDVQRGRTERIEVGQLQSFTLLPMNPVRGATPEPLPN
jgi:hypothetical protein